MIELEKRIENLKNMWFLTEPAYYIVLVSTQIEFTKKTNNISCGGGKIFLNVEFFDGVSDKEMEEFFKLECVRILLKHPYERVLPYRRLAYIASNMLIAEHMNFKHINIIKYNDNTLKTLAEQYYASSFRGTPGSTEFDETLQKWTDDNTGNLLSDYSKEMTIPEGMVMQLVSTIYFKAQWTEPFESEKTSESVFHGTKKETTVNMMHKEKNAFAYVTNNFTQVTLGLTNGGAMHFYLPQPGVDVNTLVSDPEVLNAVTGNENLLYAEIKMSIPKFKISVL